MIAIKTYTKEEALQKKVRELELELLSANKKVAELSRYNHHLESLVKGVESTKKSTTITIKSATRVEFVEVGDIVLEPFRGEGAFYELSNGKTITATKAITKFEELLQPFSFFRISKSHLINLDSVKTFYKDRNQILLEGDILLNVARRRRVEFLKIYK